jgi:hypothetical protein
VRGAENKHAAVVLHEALMSQFQQPVSIHPIVEPMSLHSPSAPRAVEAILSLVEFEKLRLGSASLL